MEGDTGMRNGNFYRLITTKEEKDTPNQLLTSSSLWKGLKDRSTSHIIPQLENVPGRIKRLVWCLISLGTLIMLIYTMEEIIRKYVGNQVHVVVHRHHLQRQIFPAITMCNMNPFKKSNVEQNAALSSILLTNSINTAKRRRKRAVEVPDCTDQNYHKSSGYCYALVDAVQGNSWQVSSKLCRNGWAFAVLDNQQKYNFVRDNPSIFSGVRNTKYWISAKSNGMNRPRWWPSNDAIAWAPWADTTRPGQGRGNRFQLQRPVAGCVYADITDSHKWSAATCREQYLTLCQLFKGLQDKSTTILTTKSTTTPKPTTTTPKPTKTTPKPTTTTPKPTTTTPKPITTTSKPTTTTPKPTTTPPKSTTTTPQPTTTTPKPIITTSKPTTTTPKPTTTTPKPTTTTSKPTITTPEPTTTTPKPIITTPKPTTTTSKPTITTPEPTTTPKPTITTSKPTITTPKPTTTTPQPTITTPKPTITTPEPTTTTPKSTTTTPKPTITTPKSTTTTPKPTITTPKSTTTTPKPTTKTSNPTTITPKPTTTTPKPNTTKPKPTTTTPKPTTTTPKPTPTTQKPTTTTPVKTTTKPTTTTTPTTTQKPTTATQKPTAKTPKPTTTSKSTTTEKSSTTKPKPTTTQLALNTITSKPTTTTLKPNTTATKPSTTEKPSTTPKQIKITPYHFSTTLEPTMYSIPTTPKPTTAGSKASKTTTKQIITTSNQVATTKALINATTTKLRMGMSTVSTLTKTSEIFMSTTYSATTEISTGITKKLMDTKAILSTTSGRKSNLVTSQSPIEDKITTTNTLNLKSINISQETTPYNSFTSTAIKPPATNSIHSSSWSATTDYSTSVINPLSNATCPETSGVPMMNTTAKYETSSWKSIITSVFVDVSNPATTTVSNVITTYKPPPAPAPIHVKGSKFPERIQTTKHFSEEEKTYEILADISEEEKSSLGFTASEFVVDCQYAGYTCKPEQLSYFYNAIHGNCYTFNSGWNHSVPTVWSTKIGPRYGFKAVLNIDQDQYIKKFGEAAGVRLVIHSQDKMPFPEDEGIMARTGYTSSIGVSMLSIEKLGPPYTECFHLDERDLKRNVYEEYYNVKYSTLACYKTCYQMYVIKECGCSDPGYPSYGEAFGFVRVSACNSSNIVQDDCKYNITKMYAANKLQCYCEDPCQEVFYLPEMSEMRWPSDKSKENFIAKHKSKIQNVLNSTQKGKFRENLAKIEVHFHTFEQESIVEKPSYASTKFYTDIGGSLGLWIGWSCVTAFEFVEFFIDLMVLVCYKFKARKIDKDGDILRKPSRKNTFPQRSVSYISDNYDMEEIKTFSQYEAKNSFLPSHLDTRRDSGISSASSEDHAHDKQSLRKTRDGKIYRGSAPSKTRQLNKNRTFIQKK